MTRNSSTPDEGELDKAPLLGRWCAIRDQGEYRLLGVVTGHPLLREGARTRTSPYLTINKEKGWARTWNRFYRLGQYDPSFLRETQIDGVISPNVELIDFDNDAL